MVGVFFLHSKDTKISCFGGASYFRNNMSRKLSASPPSSTSSVSPFAAEALLAGTTSLLSHSGQPVISLIPSAASKSRVGSPPGEINIYSCIYLFVSRYVCLCFV